MKAYKTAARAASDEFTEKKSVFIGYIRPVPDEDAAKAFIAEIKKKHADAKHNVYAYILQGTGIARFSDDGEPQGTAGMPILEVLKREELCGVAVVVTRYFGGILLGAGGLTRAYAKAAKLAVDAAGVAEFRPFVTFRLTIGYPYYEKIAKELPTYGVKLDGSDFGTEVTLSLAVREDGIERFHTFVTELTNGTALFETTGSRYDA